jgi:branched-chain amino acid transport system permease protein
MTQLLQTLVDGLTVGALYALIALGYTMVYGILKFINFAHSDIFALGVHMTIVIAGWLGVVATASTLPPWYVGPLVLVMAMLSCGLVGFIIERFAYRPLRNAPRINVLITAIGVSLFLQNIGQLKPLSDSLGIPFSPYPRAIPPLLESTVLNDSTIAEGTLFPRDDGSVVIDHDVTLEPNRRYRLDIMLPDGVERTVRITAPAGTIPAGASIPTTPPLSDAPASSALYELVRAPRVPISLVDVTVIGTALLLMLALQYLIYSTKLGMAMRAVSFSPRNASLMGINVDRVISLTFVIGSMLAAAAGFLYALKYQGQAKQTADSMWVMLGLKAFVAAVVGGIGNVRGAVLGGLLIGLIEFFGVAYVSSNYRDAYVFAILIIVLLFRPEGVLGRATVEKV